MTSRNPISSAVIAPLPKLSYNRTEAARILGISANSLDRLVKRGLIAPSRALRRPLFALADLERFLEATR